MKYGMMGRRLLASTLALSLAPALALSASVLTPAIAKAEVGAARCQVHSVLAKKTGDGTIPDDLKFLEDQLRSDQFAAYKSFRLLEKHDLRLDVANAVATDMKSGHVLTLEYFGADAGKLKFKATLLARGGDATLFDGLLQLPDPGIFWIGGGRYGKDKILFAIRCVHIEAIKK